ncbi:MAG: FAD-dependent oxidoreductase [Theionarchaea archaeon]|nr:FAD-dependent oxidoreductase [Theionarchaea archaeon]
MSTYTYPAKDIPVLGEYDVIVVGGGSAGCAAALSASRHGAKTLILERCGYLGGAMVSQLVATILSTNGVDFQGIWHEFMGEMRKRGGTGDLVRLHSGDIGGAVDPEIAKHVWDAMLSGSNVGILHHVQVSDAIIENGRIKGVVVETISGISAIFGCLIVDCTGDGTVCARAGVPWEQGDGDHKWAMATTTIFRMGNARRPEGFPNPDYLKVLEEGTERAIEGKKYSTPIITSGRAKGYARRWRGWTAPPHRIETTHVTGRVLEVDPLDPWDLTRAEREGRQQAWQVQDYYRRNAPGYEEAYLVDTSSHTGIRSSRRIRGLARVCREDVLALRKYPDGIARSSWRVDIWPADSYTAAPDAYTDDGWKSRINGGDYFDIRYGCLVARGVDNLLVAGRCISADHWAQSSLRIQQTCQSTGQAAGTAAALSLEYDVTPRKLDVRKLVDQLKQDRAGVEPAFEILKNLPIARRS